MPTTDDQSRHLPELFLWAYQFEAGGRGRALRVDDVPGALAAASGWTWLHIGLANQRARDWLVADPAVPQAVRAVLLDETERLQLEPAGVGVAGILADLKRDVVGGAHEVSRLRFALDERLLITCRRSALHAVEDAHVAVAHGRAFAHPSDLLGFIVGRFCDAIAMRARALSETLDRAEDHLVHHGRTDDGEAVSAARRGALVLHRQLQALCILFSTFLEDEDAGPPAFRYVAERLDRRLSLLDRELQGIQDRARLILDEIAAKVAAATNTNLQALSVMTALFLPPTLVTGVFGMNTKGMFFGEDPWGTVFAILVACGASFCAYLVLRRLGVAR